MTSQAEQLSLQHDLADRIYSTYVGNLYQIPPKERIHFVRRAYRIRGEEELMAIIDSWTRLRTVPMIKKRSDSLRTIVGRNDPYPSVAFKPSNNLRLAQRNKLFSQRPELQFYRRYLMDLFQAYTCGVDQTLLRKEWDGYIELLRSVDFESIYIDLQVLSKASSFAVNSVIFLDKLGVDPGIQRRFIGYLRGAYLNEDLSLVEELSAASYTSFIYNLTHIVIARSSFYQQWVSGPLWVGQFFAENVDVILSRCSYDVIAEVGLSLKLMKLDATYPDQYSKLINHILKNYNFDVSLSSEYLKRREHTNAVLMLLFSEISTWKKGPYVI